MVDKLRVMVDASKTSCPNRANPSLATCHHGLALPLLHSSKSFQFSIHQTQTTPNPVSHRQTGQETSLGNPRFPAPNIPRRPLQPLRRYKCRSKPCHNHPNTLGTASPDNPPRPCRRPSTRDPCSRCTSRRSDLRDFRASSSTAAHRCNGRGG